MPGDDEKRRHRARDSRDYSSDDGKDRDRKSHGKHRKRKGDESSKRLRRHHGDSSDEQIEKFKQDRKKRRRDDDKGERDDERSIKDRHSRPSNHRHRSERKDSSDRKKAVRKSDDQKRKKRKRKESRREDSSGDETSRKKSMERAKSAKRDKSTLYNMGDPIGTPPSTFIDPENDYFTYHQEFWVYLFREEGVRFNDMHSGEAREAFVRFARLFNAGKLEAPYYDNPPTFPPQVLEESKTTRHKWGFQTTATERKGLEQLQEGVRRLTQYNESSDRKYDGAADAARSSNSDAEKTLGRDISEGTSHGRRKTPEERTEEYRANRRLRETVRTTEDELTGGAKDFRERQLEKKREQAYRMHGSSRDKEEGGAGAELGDAVVYGEGDLSFKQALARERQSKARREEQRSARVEELKNKEQERQSNMLKALGLDGMKPGQKIQIAPRKDS
jgi:hypothetical protein